MFCNLAATWLLCTFLLANAFTLPERTVPLPPSQDSFYDVPEDVEKHFPGAILKQRRPPNPIAAFGLSKANLNDSYQILYRTTDSFGNATATVLTILVPHNPDYTKLLSYQIAEDAPNLDCAPSYAMQLSSKAGGVLGNIVAEAELLLIEGALEQGWVVIIPDHEGPKAAFVANKLAGQAILDGIRAAISSSNTTGIDKHPKVALWGYSGGAITSARAAELHASYAPELDIVGMAIGGTEPNITSVLNYINGKGPAGLIQSAVVGLANEYPVIADLVQKHIKPKYRPAMEKTKQRCLPGNGLAFAFSNFYSMLDDSSVLKTPEVVKVLDDNGMGHGTPTMPVYLYKSIFDEISPIKDTDGIYDLYCSRNASIQYERDELSEHGILALTGAPRALAFLIDVLNGRPQPAGCSKKTVVSSLFDAQASKVLPKFLIDAMLDLIGRPIGPPFFG